MNNLIEVKESAIHTKGVFAKTDIKKDTCIIEYKGRKIKRSEGDKIVEESHERHKKNKEHAGTYLFELDNEYDLDGDIPYNDAKYINHSCHPNSEYRIIA